MSSTMSKFIEKVIGVLLAVPQMGVLFWVVRRIFPIDTPPSAFALATLVAVVLVVLELGVIEKAMKFDGIYSGFGSQKIKIAAILIVVLGFTIALFIFELSQRH